MSSPVADEAARLVEALEEWVRARGGSGAAAASAFTGSVGEALGGHVATESAECTLCPVCQAIRLLRGTRPEAFEHLVAAAGSLLQALRVAVDADRSGSARQSRVQHIDIQG